MTEPIVSDKLLDARYKRDYDARQEAMLAAWRTWRAGVIKAMAARLAQVGAQAGPEDDQEMALLGMEFDHCQMVRASLSHELGVIDDDE